VRADAVIVRRNLETQNNLADHCRSGSFSTLSSEAVGPIGVRCTTNSDQKVNAGRPVEMGQSTKSLRDSPLTRGLEPIGRQPDERRTIA
jgi:hypothetical protein